MPTFQGVPKHGVSKHNNVTRELFLRPCGYTTGIVTNTGFRTTVNFADAADNIIHFDFKVPDNFAGLLKVELVWFSSAASGNMFWEMIAVFGAAGEANDGNADYPGSATTATGGAGIINVQEPANALTLSGLAKGDYVGIQVTRVGSHPLDTLTNVAKIIGLLFTYTAEQ